MNKNHHPKTRLDEALASISRTDPGPVQTTAAGERVWRKLEAAAEADAQPLAENEPIRGCAAFQSLIPAYCDGALSPARQALLEDHGRECVTCRKMLWKSTSPDALNKVSPHIQPGAGRYWKWGAAAAAVLALALAFQLGMLDNLFLSKTGVRAVAERLDGNLFRVSNGGLSPLAVGQAIQAKETVRAGRGARPVLKMADGSRIEMNERSELSLQTRLDGACIALHQGSIIVQAAKQQAGHHLYVDTTDCQVAVKGTVFSVTRGTRGSRVSVLEGEVWVDQSGHTTKLYPGQQVSTHSSINPVPIKQEVAWSNNFQKYEGLLNEVRDVSRELLDKISSVPLRYESSLLKMIPPNAYIYIAVPNVSQELADAGATLQNRIQSNPALRQWWDEKVKTDPRMPDVTEMIDRFKLLGSHLGDEIVLTIWEKSDQSTGVMILAKAADSTSLKAAIEDDLKRLTSLSQKELPVVVRESAADFPASGRDTLNVLVADGYMAVANDTEELRRFSQSVQILSGAFSQTAFYSQLAKSYQDGAGWLVAMDLQGVAKAHQSHGKHEETPRQEDSRWGFSDLQTLVLEQKTINQQTQVRAAVTFNQQRRGIASWLGAPAPMGTLEFVSPDAYVAACFVVKEPKAIVDEIFAILKDTDSDALARLLEFQAQHGLSLRDDLAAPLGGEFMFAIDGPVLPKPAWKVALLMDDQVHFQQTVEKALAEVNKQLAADGKPQLTLNSEVTGGTTYFTVILPEDGPEVHYVYWDGYLLLAPSRALLTQAIQNRGSGYTLPRSENFQKAMPVDGHDLFSGIVYQNFQKLLGSLTNNIPAGKSGLPQADLQKLKEYLQQAKPMVFCAYGETDRIVVTGTGLEWLNPLKWEHFGDLSQLLNSQKGKSPEVRLFRHRAESVH